MVLNVATVLAVRLVAKVSMDESEPRRWLLLLGAVVVGSLSCGNLDRNFDSTPLPPWFLVPAVA